MCFSLETNYNHRKEVYEYLKNMSWISNLCKFNTNKYLNDEDFITNCYNHDFVICPFGNGIDCGRTLSCNLLTRIYTYTPISYFFCKLGRKITNYFI